jgi:polyisoprenyl-phosphate glycosyltransferase
MEKNKSLSVICPVYNEQEVISQFIIELTDVLKSIEGRYTWDIMFVLDRSTDLTLEILKDAANKYRNIKVLVLSSRFGHQMSLVAGIDHCESDIIIMMDSDLQHPPKLIPKLLDTYEAGNDIVFTIRNESLDKNPIKRLGSNFFYILINFLSDIPLESGEADYRLISKRVASIFRNNIRERNQFLRGLFSWVGFPRKGIRYDPAKRTHGESKYTWARSIKFALSGIVSFSRKPLRYAIIVGLVFALFGLLLASYSFFMYFYDEQVPTGWTTLSIVISVFGGLQFLFFGILGEYIGSIFDEVKARPLYIVEERFNID